MTPPVIRSSFSLFWFYVPGMPDLRLAVTLPELLEVTHIDVLKPVPFAAYFTLGIGYWRKEILTAIDLGAMLRGPDSSVVVPGDKTRIIVIRADVEKGRELVAWPILDGGRIECPGLAPVAASPEGLPTEVLRASVVLNEQEYHLLDTGGLIHFAQEQGAEQIPLHLPS